MSFEITIHCPELAQLAQAIATVKTENIPVSATAAAPVSTSVTTPTLAVPQSNPDAQPAMLPTNPAASVNPPAMAAPALQTGPVAPTAAPSYTMDQLAKAGAELAQAGKMPQLLGLLQQYGVPAVTQLPKEQYGAFALALRGLGAQL